LGTCFTPLLSHLPVALPTQHRLTCAKHTVPLVQSTSVYVSPSRWYPCTLTPARRFTHTTPSHLCKAQVFTRPPHGGTHSSGYPCRKVYPRTYHETNRDRVVIENMTQIFTQYMTVIVYVHKHRNVYSMPFYPIMFHACFLK
jgi:hypothetical protein